MNPFKRNVYVRPIHVEGELKWEVIELSTVEAFFDDCRLYGVKIAFNNLFVMFGWKTGLPEDATDAA